MSFFVPVWPEEVEALEEARLEGAAVVFGLLGMAYAIRMNDLRRRFSDERDSLDRRSTHDDG